MIDITHLTNDDHHLITMIVKQYIHWEIVHERTVEKFNLLGSPSKFQELERKNLVFTHHHGDRNKNRQYWWYLTDDGLEFINNLVELKKL